MLKLFRARSLGHQYLIDFAQQFVDKLYIVVEAMPHETIPVTLRQAWLMTLFPTCEVITLSDYNPQYPEEDPDFWSIWQASLTSCLPEPIDYLFASETYGVPLAECLRAQFIPVDPQRERYPISGTQIRNDLYTHWRWLTQPAQKQLQKSVCICGPESTGKTTLTQWLAEQLNGETERLAQPIYEYARTFLSQHNALEEKQMLHIAKGQQITENIDSSTPLKIVDTGYFASLIWSEFLFQTVDPRLDELCRTAHYDLYLLCAPDVPWVDDEQRYLPDQGDAFMQRMQQLINDIAPDKVIVIAGDWKSRQQTALRAVKALLSDALSKPK